MSVCRCEAEIQYVGNSRNVHILPLINNNVLAQPPGPYWVVYGMFQEWSCPWIEEPQAQSCLKSFGRAWKSWSYKYEQWGAESGLCFGWTHLVSCTQLEKNPKQTDPKIFWVRTYRGICTAELPSQIRISKLWFLSLGFRLSSSWWQLLNWALKYFLLFGETRFSSEWLMSSYLK